MGLLPNVKCYYIDCSREKIFNIKDFLFFKIYLFILRERRRGGERAGEKHQCVVASCTPPIGDLAHNPGMCPDQESNQGPFGSQARAQSTETHQPGLLLKFFLNYEASLRV